MKRRQSGEKHSQQTPMDDSNAKGKASAASQSNPAVVLGTSLAMGLAFGFAIEKGQVYIPRRIIGQMLFRDFTMLKMFLSAASTSMAVHAFLSLVTPHRVQSVRKCNEDEVPGFAAVAVGAGLLGAGMAICGACPGTVLVQQGIGLRDAWIVFGGGLGGAFLYSMLDHFGAVTSLNNMGRSPAVCKSVDEHLHKPYAPVALGGAAVLAAAVALVEYLQPYQPVAPVAAASVLKLGSWAPYIAGAVVGLLQLPGILLVGRAIGSSSAYVTFCGAVLPVNAYLKKFGTLSLARLSQPTYLIGAVLGGFLSSQMSGHALWTQGNGVGTADGGVGVALSAAGGVILLLGSRMANGCTSGHGISGFSQLSERSVVAVASMFGVGIATALTLNAFGVYPAHLKL